LRAGESVTAGDGYGRWRAFLVDTASAGTVRLVATSPIVHEPLLAPRLAVAFALTKGTKPELVVQKLTELGVDRIVVVSAARSIARWDATRAGAAMDRLQRVTREAGAQCRRARLPVIDGPVAPLELAGHPGLVVAAPDGTGPQDLPLPPDGEWLVAVGPEGGFDAFELAAFGTAPHVSLGPFVLRAETAAIASAVALNTRRTRLP
ncbi:MAG TPA: RsmE family RNA methyltransferase, partial [Acidimicrobiia bacterium]